MIGLWLQEIFEEHPEVRLCFDLLDPGFAICSASIPPLFADNFDCQVSQFVFKILLDVFSTANFGFLQTLDDFVSGVIENDLLENTLYLAELTDGYAARVSSLHTYQAVNRDVLRRWTYPLVPDLKGEGYKFGKNNVYRGKNVMLSRYYACKNHASKNYKRNFIYFQGKPFGGGYAGRTRYVDR